MEAVSKVLELKNIMENREVDFAILQQEKKTKEMYKGDYNRFLKYCMKENREPSFESLEKYLYRTVTKDLLKLSTFNRRAAGITYYLLNELNHTLTNDQLKRIQLIRQMYDNEEYRDQKLMRGQSAQPKEEIMHLIEKLDVRAKAICLFNLVTASRPSEMITVQLKHINLEKREVSVYIQKQKVWKIKRLTLQCALVIKEYIAAFNLMSEDYLVGRVNRYQQYTSVKISDVAYRESIKKWLGFAPYTLRKTQISAMHEAGADLATIAKQSGHKSLQTINEHYLEVNNTTIDKYL
ncbi:hypothetical protein B1B04_10380 [Lysinibacillus sp. KCTC 33748]|uniref:site-specific integrase n=1 Tax=unclassified Lysinibacillus TaxID=2636778 RepID=UPI0009A64A52|nr:MULTISPECIES: site-specific integrase [unclassified Lysinibacillus]OXS74011.1 hypothetical protein B1B04_10380 [Lysinibacillus sp. KCTC 33748]SKB69165.1 integrase/recombinase XerC [Lysinibacillus sp. AC-3]